MYKHFTVNKLEKKTKAIEVDFGSIKNLGISTEDNSQLPTKVQASLCIARTPPQLW
jgi:hypothetical protein